MAHQALNGGQNLSVDLNDQAATADINNHAAPAGVDNQAAAAEVDKLATPAEIDNQAALADVDNHAASVNVNTQAATADTDNQAAPADTDNHNGPTNVSSLATPANVNDQPPPVPKATRASKRLRDRELIASTEPSQKRRAVGSSKTKKNDLVSKLRDKITELSTEVFNLTEENENIKLLSAASQCPQCRQQFLETLALRRESWGKKNKGFLGLPTEIREMIYDRVRNLYSDEEREVSTKGNFPISTNYYPTALIKVNHQLRVEVESHYQKKNYVFIPINRRICTSCQGVGDKRFKDAIVLRMLERAKEVVISIVMHPGNWSFEMARELAYVFSRLVPDSSTSHLEKVHLEWYQVDPYRQGGQEFPCPWSNSGQREVEGHQTWRELLKTILANVIYRKPFNAEVSIDSIEYDRGGYQHHMTENELDRFEDELSELVKACASTPLTLKPVLLLHEEQPVRYRA